MSKKPEEDQDDPEEVSEFEEFVEPEPVDFKVDVAMDKKLHLERRRKIEEKIELYRLRDQCGFYDLEI